MGRLVSQRWTPDPRAFGSRRARQGGTFQAYVPRPLAEWSVALDARTAADIADAEKSIVELDRRAEAAGGRGDVPHRLEVLARLLLRAEAVGSSRVEGLVVSPQSLERAWWSPETAPSPRAREVVGNIRALQEALQEADSGTPMSVESLCRIHATLLRQTTDAAIAGQIREEQNWIGGVSPLHAAFVPPPHDELPELLADLCRYLNDDAHSPLVQAAVAHAQFETLHPFADGNGRTGRALLQLVLRRRGLCHTVVPPISLVLATWSDRYVEGLMGTRVVEEQALGAGWHAWLELVAEAVRTACAHAHDYEQSLDALVESWRERLVASLGPIRSDAAVWVLMALLPAAPLLDARAARELTGRSARAVDKAIDQLVAARILRKTSGRQRYRRYEAREVFHLITRTERALASPLGDTRQAKPARPVPARPC
jgi:Fic family protein